VSARHPLRYLLTATIQHCVTGIYFRYQGLVVIRDPFLASLYLNNLASVPSLIRAAMYGLSAFGMEVMLVRLLHAPYSAPVLISAGL
jgi:ABC-type phosphate transport system permease subunit